MSAKHTPGPWRVNENFGIITSVEYKSADPLWFSVCTMGSIGSKTTTNNEQSANAHLIAAAPDMLDALESMVNTMQLSAVPGGLAMSGPSEESIRKAQKAIAKAKGEKL